MSAMVSSISKSVMLAAGIKWKKKKMIQSRQCCNNYFSNVATIIFSCFMVNIAYNIFFNVDVAAGLLVVVEVKYIDS